MYKSCLSIGTLIAEKCPLRSFLVLRKKQNQIYHHPSIGNMLHAGLEFQSRIIRLIIRPWQNLQHVIHDNMAYISSQAFSSALFQLVVARCRPSLLSFQNRPDQASSSAYPPFPLSSFPCYKDGPQQLRGPYSSVF